MRDYVKDRGPERWRELGYEPVAYEGYQYGPWFGGSHWIPGTDTCHGDAWRSLVVAGLKQASVAAC